MSHRRLHFVVVCDHVPHSEHGGGGVTMESVVLALKAEADNVTVVALKPDPIQPERDRHRIERLKEKGIDVVSLVPVEKSKTFSFGRRITEAIGRSHFFFGYSVAGQVLEKLLSLKPDAVFAYHWDAIAALSGYRQAPIFGAVGDPAHLPKLYRRNLFNAFDENSAPHKKWAEFRLASRLKKLERIQFDLLRSCTVAGAFASHHAADYRRQKIDCFYLQTPIADPGLPTVERQVTVSPFRILLIGHLKGIATLSGLKLFTEETFPELVKTFPPGSFQVRIVGGFVDSLPETLKARLMHPSVAFLGQINPADDEFKRAHVVLVPTPIKLGIRVRILTAFSFGKAVVAHDSNRFGIPELVNQENCLLSDSGFGLARDCYFLYQHPDFRAAIAKNARGTYENFFSPSSAGQKIARVMLDLAR